MNDRRLQAYQAFIAAHRRKLAWIAHRTGLEHQREDVEMEAWVQAEELGGTDTAFDLFDPACQDRLLARLYNRLVKFAEKQVRHGVRLDHGSDEDDDCHPLLRKLASDDGADPLANALLDENPVPEPEAPGPHHSPAASYAWLLHRHCDSRMRRLAQFLRISTSHCYRCYNRARHIAWTQWPLPEMQPSAASNDDERSLRPWRPFRIRRRTVQLEFPFCANRELWRDLPR